MTELPFHLRALPSEALDILRLYFADPAAALDSGSIMDGAHLSERGFGKALRRLVTRKYVEMVSEGIYRLTEPGKRSLKELQAWDAIAPELKAAPKEPRFITRKMIVALPRVLLSGQPTNVYVGFDEPSDDDILRDPVNLILRVVIVNGTEETGSERAYRLTNYTGRAAFEVTAGGYSKARVRVHVCQLGDDDSDVDADLCPGMYVDVPVTLDTSEADGSLVAYATDIFIREEG